MVERVLEDKWKKDLREVVCLDQVTLAVIENSCATARIDGDLMWLQEGLSRGGQA